MGEMSEGYSPGEDNPKLRISESLNQPPADTSESKLRMSKNLQESLASTEEVSPEEKLAQAEADGQIESFLQSLTFIQRDTGKEYHVIGFTDHQYGYRMIQISDGKRKFGTSLAGFLSKIKTAGEAWSIKS